jgi:uncharacterized surface protein with fasciclin (FAS1) repeats
MMQRKHCSWPMKAAWIPMMMWKQSMSEWKKATSPCETRSEGSKSPASSGMDSDMVDALARSGFFTNLLKAVETAGLEDVLRSAGPWTLFAPSDEAFSKIPEGALGELIQDKEKLQKVLKHHLVPGFYPASNIGGIRALGTAGGTSLPLDARLGVRVAAAWVIQPDIRVSNGVIHVIDSVLLPSE